MGFFGVYSGLLFGLLGFPGIWNPCSRAAKLHMRSLDHGGRWQSYVLAEGRTEEAEAALRGVQNSRAPSFRGWWYTAVYSALHRGRACGESCSLAGVQAC